MDEALKKALDDIQQRFSEFRTANDERIAKLEAGDLVDPLLTERVDKLNNEISDLQSRIEGMQKERDESVLQAQRLAAAGVGAGASEHARQFHAMVTNTPLEEVISVDLETYNAYRRAFTSYLRKGDKQIGIANLLQVGSDPDGGYWVTPDVSGRMAELIYESSPMRQIANVATIGTDALEGINDLNEAGNEGWVAELGARTADTDTPGTGVWRIPVHEQYAQPSITQKMLDDGSIDVEGWLTRKTGSRIGRVEATAFFTGTGSGQPRGLLTYDHGVPSAAVWDRIERIATGVSGAFDTPGNDGADVLIDMIFALKDAYLAGSTFLMRRTTEAAVRKLKDGDGNYLWQPDFQNLKATQLLGFPIRRAEDMPAIAANSLSIAFGNFAEAYQIVDRGGIRVLRDPFTTKGRVKFYTTKRVGGDVVNFEAVKLLRFATTAS